LWATEWDEIQPDIILTSKALGGGVPISAAIARDEILEAWGPGAHVSTQAGNVLACAAGNKLLDIVSDEAFLKTVQEKGKYFTEGLQTLQNKSPFIGRIDSRGLYIGVEIVKDKESKDPGVDEASAILNECLKEGIVFEKGGYFHNRLQFIPPLTITYETIDLTLSKLDKIFERVRNS